jgi:predicted Fe-Mo cluster-binding NifX family protein
MRFDAVENDAAHLSCGAGVPAAFLVVKRRTDAVLTGRIGPTAAEALSQSGVPIYTGIEGSVKDAIQRFYDDELDRIERETTESGLGLR